MKPCLNFDKDLVNTSLGVLREVKKYNKECKKGILEFDLPEPNFTRVLQGLKGREGLNVWTDDWTSFDTKLDNVHVRIACTTRRLSDSIIRKYKGENSL